MNKDSFRLRHRNLTEAERTAIEDIKIQAQSVEAVLDTAVEGIALIDKSTPEGKHRAGERGRALALSRTKLQEAVFWATHGITA